MYFAICGMLYIIGNLLYSEYITKLFYKIFVPMYELWYSFINAGTRFETQVMADCANVRKGIPHVTWLHRQQTAFCGSTACLLD